jgi:ABC-type enterochelin transport system permease subunit
METPTNDRQTANRRLDIWGGAVSHSRNLGVDVRHSSESGYVVVAVLLLIFTCLVLPLMVMLYFDSLTLNKKTERTEARIEKKLKDLEEKDKK